MALPFSDMVIIGEAYKDIKTSFLYICQSPYLKSVGYFIVKEDIMSRYKIIDCGDYYTIANINGGYEDHCHVNTKKTAKMLVKLMKKKRVPRSDYLRESVKRVTLDERYIEDINIKTEKDRDKQKYRNIGGRGAKV